MLLHFLSLFVGIKSSKFALLFNGTSSLVYPLPKPLEYLSFSYLTPLHYGLIFHFSDQLNNSVIRLEVINSSTCVVCHGALRKYYFPCSADSWNRVKLSRTSKDIFDVYLNKQSVEIASVNNNSNYISDSYKYHQTFLRFGGLGDVRDPSFQFLGKIRNIIINDDDNIAYKPIQLASSDFPIRGIKLSSIKVNNTDVRIPIGFISSDKTSSDRISLFLEFLTPETNVRLVSFTSRNYYLNLAKVNNQLRLRLNLRGYNERLSVELVQDGHWIPVTMTIDSEKTFLETRKRNTIRKGDSGIGQKIKKVPLYLGPGFRGCVRSIKLNGNVISLVEQVINRTGVFVGCKFPSKSCEEMECGKSCSRSWDRTSCISVTRTPVVELNGFGIIEVILPSLITPDQKNVTIALNIAFQKSNGVVLRAELANPNKTFISMQMVGDNLLFSGSSDISVNYNVKLKDKVFHQITILLSEDQISFQIDESIHTVYTEVNLDEFNVKTTLKLGGSSMMTQSYRFSGCLSDVRINDIDIMAMITDPDNAASVTLDNISLKDTCSFVDDKPREITTPPLLPAIETTEKALAKTDSQKSTLNGTARERSTTETVGTSDNKSNDKVLIIILLGLILTLGALVFVVYFFWQRKQMIQTEKRDTSSYVELEEDIIKRNYNNHINKEQIVFIPHALDVILEENEDILSTGSFKIERDSENDRESENGEIENMYL